MIRCYIFGHDWDVREKNPHRETDDGAAATCRRCGKWEWDYE